MSLITSVLTGGSNSHATTSEEANAVATDFISQGIVGSSTNTSGVAPATGNFAVNAQASPDATVAVSTGVAYVTATPSSQGSQKLRVKNSASANVTISANSSGSTKYDWLYLVVSAANAANPNSAADNVATLTTSRSSSSTSDDGTPPTYGLLLAVVTVANGFSTITNGTISDRRVQSIASSATSALSAVVNDFVESGCVWTADAAGSTRLASMTAGYVWLSGQRLTVAAVSGRTFTASKDVYVDLSNNGDGTAAFTYTDGTTNAASGALTAGSLRLAIIVVGATNIASAASINQGQEGKLVPIASSVPYAVTDSLGNLICPRDPSRRLLCSRLITTTFTTTTAGSQVDITGLTLVPVIVPTGRKIHAVVTANEVKSSEAAGNGVYIYAVDVTSAQNIGNSHTDEPVTAYTVNGSFTSVPYTPSASGARTFKLQGKQDAAGTLTVTASATNPVCLALYLI